METTTYNPHLDQVLHEWRAYTDIDRDRYLIQFYSSPNVAPFGPLETLPVPVLENLLISLPAEAVSLAQHDNRDQRLMVHLQVWLLRRLTAISWPTLQAYIDQCSANASQYSVPIVAVVNSIERAVKATAPPGNFSTSISQLMDIEWSWSANWLEYDKIRLRLQKIRKQLFGASNIRLFSDDDAFGKALNDQLVAESPGSPWARFLEELIINDSSKPSAKWLKTVGALTTELGAETLLQRSEALLRTIAAMPVQGTANDWGYGCYFFAGTNMNAARTLVWALPGDLPEHFIPLFGELVIKGYEKVHPRSTDTCGMAFANVCIGRLGTYSSMKAVAELSRARRRILRRDGVALIDRAIAAFAGRQGLTVDLVEDMAVPDFGLDATHTLRQAFGEYTAEARLMPDGKIKVHWTNTAGAALKSEPAAVKASAAEDLKAFKSTVKQVEATFAVQKDRLDHSWRQNRQLSWPHFEQYYLCHPLLNVLASQQIWTIEENGGRHDVLPDPAGWLDRHGKSAQLAPGPMAVVRPWHPVSRPVEEVLAWRELLLARSIRQPVRQAFREVYVLTDAERNTYAYSNRMAAHVVRQHQVNSLAKLRGWQYTVIGNWDDGRDADSARLQLPAFDLIAEFWINALYNEDDSAFGGLPYVSTDQVRFRRPNLPEPLPLEEVDALAFTEVMRDIDLFVGVGSIGNDPTWNDGGTEAHRRFHDYWQSYSFGELGELAKTRYAVLEKLLPKLKIAAQCALDGRYLRVKGKLRTYKIHLGSTNILMEPNDQYLCIVPARGATTPQEKVFLPFEGDAGLSLVLSKAFLLAEDDKIKDLSITGQILGR